MRKSQLTILAGLLALVSWPALAQTATSTSSPASSTGGGFSWLWLIVLLAVIGAAVWYFGYARSRTHTTSSMGVDRERVARSAEHAKGSVKEGVGNVLGDAKLQAEGRADQAEGKAQNTVGGIKDTLRGQ